MSESKTVCNYFTLPKVCCRCAQRPGVSEVEYFQIGGEGIIASHFNSISYSISLPLCNECKQVTDKREWVRLTICLASGIIVAAVGAFVSYFDLFQINPFFAVVMGFLGGNIWAFFITSKVMRLELVKISRRGKGLTFANKEYQRQFAALVAGNGNCPNSLRVALYQERYKHGG